MKKSVFDIQKDQSPFEYQTPTLMEVLLLFFD
jgi:hypothetical protein